MSDYELEHPSVNMTIPQHKRAMREKIERDTQAFLASGGAIKTVADEIPGNRILSQAYVANLLGTHPVALQTGIRSGRLFGEDFPAPCKRVGYEPQWYARDILAFYRKTRANQGESAA